MASVDLSWAPPEKSDNALFLRAKYGGVFQALAELDAFGFRLANRLSSEGTIEDVDSLVGLVLLRRNSTVLAGIRHLFEGAAIEPAKPLVRAAFEVYLTIRYLIYGGKRPIWQCPARC